MLLFLLLFHTYIQCIILAKNVANSMNLLLRCIECVDTNEKAKRVIAEMDSILALGTLSLSFFPFLPNFVRETCVSFGITPSADERNEYILHRRFFNDTCDPYEYIKKQ